MTDKTLVINCKTGEEVERPLTPEEQAQVDAHRATAQAQQSVLAAEEQAQTEINNDLTALRAKAKAVRAGTDTFTTAQLQKIVAGIVLRLTRD